MRLAPQKPFKWKIHPNGNCSTKVVLHCKIASGVEPRLSSWERPPGVVNDFRRFTIYQDLWSAVLWQNSSWNGYIFFAIFEISFFHSYGHIFFVDRNFAALYMLWLPLHSIIPTTRSLNLVQIFAQRNSYDLTFPNDHHVPGLTTCLHSCINCYVQIWPEKVASTFFRPSIAEKPLFTPKFIF